MIRFKHVPVAFVFLKVFSSLTLFPSVLATFVANLIFRSVGLGTKPYYTQHKSDFS